METESEIIQRNIAEGKKAKSAYDMYVSNFIAQSKTKIHKTFDELPLSELEAIKTLKIMQTAILSLEQNILTDIETGELAIKQSQNNILK